MMIRFIVLFVVSHAALVLPAHAKDFSGYEEILRELNESQIRAPLPTSSSGLDSVKIHASVAAVGTRLSFDAPKGIPGSATLRGAEATLGIDLFSPNWIAEGSVRSFQQENFADNQIRLKEFDLKFVHKRNFRSLFMRAGAGVAARYLDFEKALGESLANSYTTPSSLFLFGLGLQINAGLAVSAEASYRSALIDETIDKNSIDGSLRFTGTF